MFKRIFTSTLAIILVIALTCGMVACKKDKDSSDDDSKPSQSAFNNAYSALFDSLLTGIDNYYELSESYNAKDMSFNATMGVEFSHELASLLQTMTGYDLSWLNNVEYSFSGNSKNNLLSTTVGMSYNNTDVLTAKIIIDVLSEYAYIGFPELSEVFAAQSFAGDPNMSPSFSSIFNSLSSIDPSEALPDKAALKSLLKNVFDAAISSVKPDSSEKDVTVTANGISQKCTKYTVDLSINDCCKMALVVLNQLKNDKNLKTIIEHTVDFVYDTVVSNGGEWEFDFTSADAYAVVIEEIDGLIQTINALTSSMSSYGDMNILTWTSYVASNKLVGVEFEINSSIFGGAGMENTSIYILNTTSGTNGGFELGANVNGQTYFQILGETTKNGTKTSGTYDIKVNIGTLTSVAIVELENVDTSAGRFTGAVSVYPSKALMDLISSNIATPDYPEYYDASAPAFDISAINIANLGIKFDVQENTATSFKLAISIMSAKTPYATFNVAASVGAGQDISLPGNVTEDIDSWEDELFSEEKLIEILTNSGVPAYIIDILTGKQAIE